MDFKITSESLSFELNLEDDQIVYFLSVVATVTKIPGTTMNDMVVFYDNSQVDAIKV